MDQLTTASLLETPEKVIPVHFHHAYVIWILFFVGIALHFALQIDDISKKNKWTRREVFQAIWIPVAARAFFSAMIFGLIWQYPLLISKAFNLFGHPMSPDEADVLAIPMNNFLAGLYGFGLDSALGYIPGLKSWLPTTTSVSSIEVKQTTTVTKTEPTSSKTDTP